jgi:excinuclease ABC subunit A
MERFIEIINARSHNLKGINCQIPRGKMTVITGVSGSGKSSLAFDTLFAEGQRRYVESLSTYARQFLEKMDRPCRDHPRPHLPSPLSKKYDQECPFYGWTA